MPEISVAGTAIAQIPATTKPSAPKFRYKAKSRRRSAIYARFSVFLAPRRRCKQPRPETSIAGTAMQDSGHDRAQRGQNPGITQNRAYRSSIYAHFCVFLAPRRRCKQPRPKTSVAGTAMQDSGHDRAQRVQQTIYALFCVFLAPRRRCKQPRPKSSVAGTAMQDSGHDRAQRGQNPGIT